MESGYDPREHQLTMSACVLSHNKAATGTALATFDRTEDLAALAVSNIDFVENTLLCGTKQFLDQDTNVSEALMISLAPLRPLDQDPGPLPGRSVEPCCFPANFPPDPGMPTFSCKYRRPRRTNRGTLPHVEMGLLSPVSVHHLFSFFLRKNPGLNSGGCFPTRT